jgi:hypothetical protein
MVALALSSLSQAQVAINSNGAAPDGSAMLDIVSTSRGVLIPRLTQAQRPSTPATGLLIYQTDNTPGFYYYTGSGWVMISTGAGSSQWTATGNDIYNANSGGVGIGTAGAPNASAILDLTSTSKGLLLPRVASTGDISTPAAGMIVYQTGGTAGFYCYSGSTWSQVSTTAGVTSIAFSAPLTGGTITTTGTVGIDSTSASGVKTNYRASLDTSILHNEIVSKENSLGNPASDGYVLSSTASGTRSWISAGGVGQWTSSVDDIYNNNIGSVGIGTAGAPDASAILDLSSTSKGLLLPRVPGTGSINSPTSGLLMFNSNDQTVYYFDGTAWNQFTTGLSADPSTPLSITPGTTTTIGMSQANTGNNGWLSSTDWNTFNSKLASQWSTSGTNIYFSSGTTGNVGIGTGSTVSNRLQVTHSVAGTYPVFFQNTANSNTANVLQIKGGQSAWTTPGAKLITFINGGGAEIGNVQQTSTTGITFNNTSDSTLKKNIRLTHFTLDTLLKIKIVDFNWKSDPDDGQLNTGCIAQDLYKLYPLAVSKPETSTDKWMMSREALVPLIVKSIQDQQSQIETLKTQVSTQQAQIDALLQRVQALEAK